MRVKYLLLAVLAAAWVGTARAQPASCPGGQIGPYSVHIGPENCSVARGSDLAGFMGQKGAASGLAPLGSDSKVPSANLPPLGTPGALVASNNLSDIGSASAARVNLGLAASATTDTTNAGNISTGTLNAARLPAITTSTVGEGANLYFTTGRAAAAAPVQSVAGLTGTPTSGQVAAALGGTTGTSLAFGNDARFPAGPAGGASGAAVLDANGFVTGNGAGVTNVTTTTYTALATDRDLCVAVNAASTITLPASITTGRVYTVKDCADHAATYPITIQVAGGGLIDGYTSVIETQNAMSLDFKFQGTTWGLR